jgi:SAM-dependent methyltransferase
MPFADASFDGAYSMNVSMNIADKDTFYREINRVLKPGGWLLLSEVAKGDGGEPNYPLPWAASARASFLSTPEEIRQACSRRDSTSFGCRAPSRRRALLAPARARWSSAERSRRTAL